MKHSLRYVSTILMVCDFLFSNAAQSGEPNGIIKETDNAISNVRLDESFGTATAITPPPGWRTYTIVGGETDRWRFDNPNSRSLQSPIAAPAAIVDSDTNDPREVVLESPAFDASSSHEVRFTFNHYFFANDSLVEGKAEVYNGFTWIEVLSVRATSSSVRSESIDITSVASCASQARVRFRWVGQRRGYWIVDNVMIVRHPVTIRPLPVLVVSPASGAINVSAQTSLGWTPRAPCPSGYKLYMGTNNPPDNILNGIDVGNSTAFYQLLYEYSTTYYWKVVPYNYNGNAVDCPVSTFTTGANPIITEFPYNQNFDGSTYGWYSENENADAFTWDLTTTNPRSAPTTTIAYANTNGTTAASDWLYSPPLRMVAGHQYKVDFWTRVANASQPEALEMKWGSGQNSASMSVVPVFRDPNIVATAYQLSSALITAPDSIGSSDVHVGWHYFSAPGTRFLLLDDVSISDNGLAPVRFASFTSSRINPTKVRLSWRVLSQTQNLQFEVQKTQAPSLDYQTIAGSVVPGHGTTTTPYNYSWLDNSAISSTTYYRLKQTSIGGAVYYSNPVKLDGLTAVLGSESAPKEFMLSQNYPNPFNPGTKIQFSVAASAYTHLKVYNILGQLVATLFDGQAQAGTLYTVNFSAVSGNRTTLPSGVYFYRLQSGNGSDLKKLVLLK